MANLTKRKILLTGEPRVGKTTILRNVIEKIKHKTGFITHEIVGSSGRLGFRIETSTGFTYALAHVDFSGPRVSKYGVNISNLDNILPSLYDYGPDDLLYIDEIGQMQLYSEDFKNLVTTYLTAPNVFLGTISSVFDNEFITSVKGWSDVDIIQVTLENRLNIQSQIQTVVDTLLQL